MDAFSTKLLEASRNVRFTAHSPKKGRQQLRDAIKEIEAHLSDPRNQLIVNLAQSQAEEGCIEVDDNAVVSEGDDNGAYVQAWLWVSFDGTTLDKESLPEAAQKSAHKKAPLIA
jgi:hypothetical protein